MEMEDAGQEVRFRASWREQCLTYNQGHGHDTRAIPPQAICNLYKEYQRKDDQSINQDLSIVDFGRGLTEQQKERIVAVETVPKDLIRESQRAFLSFDKDEQEIEDDVQECVIYEHKDFPGTIPPSSISSQSI